MSPSKKSIPPLEENRLYKIGEVSRIVGVESFVLRFWETEFEEIEPVKSESKHRQYDKATIETILQIKELLHVEKYTIEGARRRLRLAREQSREAKAKGRQLALDLLGGSPTRPDPRSREAMGLLKELKSAIEEIRTGLKPTEDSTPEKPVGE